jgi:hypothetical protein
MSGDDRAGDGMSGDEIEIETGSPSTTTSSEDTELPETERRFLPYINTGPEDRLDHEMEETGDGTLGDLSTGGGDDDLIEENDFLADNGNMDYMINPNGTAEENVEEVVPRARAVPLRLDFLVFQHPIYYSF